MFFLIVSACFWDTFGATGVFAALTLLALGVLALVIGYRAENAGEISALQAILLYAVAVKATENWFTTVVFWRSAVDREVDIHDGAVNPLEKFDKIPVQFIAR